MADELQLSIEKLVYGGDGQGKGEALEPLDLARLNCGANPDSQR
jgi:hypothetical protein